MITSFNVKTRERLIELQQCMKNHMPSARFEHNPAEWCDGSYDVVISYNGLHEEENKSISELQSKWYDIDNPPEPEKVSFVKRIVNYLVDKL